MAKQIIVTFERSTLLRLLTFLLVKSECMAPSEGEMVLSLPNEDQGKLQVNAMLLLEQGLNKFRNSYIRSKDLELTDPKNALTPELALIADLLLSAKRTNANIFGVELTHDYWRNLINDFLNRLQEKDSEINTR